MPDPLAYRQIDNYKRLAAGVFFDRLFQQGRAEAVFNYHPEKLGTLLFEQLGAYNYQSISAEWISVFAKIYPIKLLRPLIMTTGH